jgi:polyferredoxin
MASKKQKASLVVWLRRLSQTVFLTFFFYLFLQTTYHPINETGGPVTFFFELDPLILLATWLSANAVPRALLLSLLVVGVTLVLGRWFCGWVCPFGAFNQLMTSLRKGKAKARMAVGGYLPAQKWKYYVLVAVLIGAVAGSNIVGLLDPFSFFFRSLSTAVYPALNSGTQQLFTWLYNEDYGIGDARVTAVSEPVYEVLRTNVLAVEQPQYAWGVLLGALFLGVVLLNLFRPRFWCRYICPLGAMLGLIGKNPTLVLKKNAEVCNDCGFCLADCPGGADPNTVGGWKPSECFYCWNCESSCPHDAISFGFGVARELKNGKADR